MLPHDLGERDEIIQTTIDHRCHDSWLQRSILMNGNIPKSHHILEAFSEILRNERLAHQDGKGFATFGWYPEAVAS